MIAINRHLCIVIMATTMLLSGCGNLQNSRPSLSISGVDTSNILILENDGGKTAVLTGTVRRTVDKKTVEEYVRTNFEYEKIVNNISIR